MSSGAAIRAGRAFVEFFIEDGRLERGLKTIERKLMMFGKRVSNIGRRAFMLATTATIALIFPLTGYAQFDDKIKELESLAARGTTTMQELRDQAKLLGRTTSFSAISVAGGQTEMAKAGFNTDEIHRGIADVMNLSRATQTELPRATEIAAGALRAFQLPITDMTRVVNTAVAAVNLSSINMEDYAEAMKYAAPIAHQFGQSIEETSKQVAILGNMQIKGSLAGTAMRNAMVRIADPKIRSEIEKFTSVIDPATGRIKTLSQIMLELGTATAGEGGQQRLERMTLFAKMFGLRAANAALILSETTANGFEEAFADPEFAAKIAKHMDSGIGGAWRRLKASWEGVTIAFGEAVDTMLQNGAAGLTRFLGVVRAIIEKNPIIAKGILVVVAAIAVLGIVGLTAGYVIQGLGMVFSVFAGILKVVRLGIMMTSTAIQFLYASALATNPLILALGLALAVASGVFVYMSGAIQKVSSFLRDTFGAAWTTIVGLISSGDLSAAFTLAMALAKATWIIGVSALKAEWYEWTGGLAGWLLDGVAGAELVWMDFTGFLVDAFDRAIAAIRDAWGSTQDWLAEVIAVGIAKTTGQDVNDVMETLKEDQARTARPNYSAQAEGRIATRTAEREAKRVEIGQRNLENNAENQRITDENVAAANVEGNRARAEFDQAQAKADELLNGSNEDDKKKKAEEEAQRLRDLFGQGPAAGGEASKANDAMLLRSKEGAEALAKAFGLAGQQDKVVGAIANLQEAVVGAVEDVGDVLDDQEEVQGW